MLPKTLKNFNVFAEGESMLGVATEVELPKLARKMEEFRAAGMDTPVNIDMGGEMLEMGITSAEIRAGLIGLFGSTDVQGAQLRFRGAIQSDDSDGSYGQVEIVARGRIKEIDFGSAKAGDQQDTKYQYSLAYYKLTIDGADLVEADVLNNTLIVNGTDRLEGMRAALGL